MILKVKRLFSVFLCAVIMLSFIGCSKGEDTGCENISDFVDKLGIGINLGNTLESCGDWIDSSSVSNYETAWGSPIITQDMIKGYADAGFGVIRVPVAWSNMMDEDYNISKEYMARVKQIVDWILDSDMCVILNIHYDGGWFSKFPTEYDECMKKYKKVWTQICEEFADYSDMLMFESLNEEGGWQELWNRYSGSDNGKAESYGILNDMNQTFVDIVRASGGRNAERFLLIAGYNTDVELTCDELFTMPKDVKENKLAVSVHYYTPSTFAILSEDADWGKASTTWGTESDFEELNRNMDMLVERFTSKGIPVIVGEYGCTFGNKTTNMIELYLTSVCEAACKRDICPVLWDITGCFYDRTGCKVNYPNIMKKMLEAKEQN